MKLNWDEISEETLWERGIPLSSDQKINHIMQFISVRRMSGTLFTVSEGQLGICWENVHEGDVVTLLKGASAPIVLRKTGESYIYLCCSCLCCGDYEW
jgi:hypothetical protein